MNGAVEPFNEVYTSLEQLIEIYPSESRKHEPSYLSRMRQIRSSSTTLIIGLRAPAVTTPLSSRPVLSS
jgi:hypothetical protein